MSRVETVRSYYDLVDAGDYDRLVELFAEDVTYHRPGQPAIEGRAALREFYETGRPLSDGSHELADVVAGDGAAVAVRGRFAGRQDGDRVAFGFADLHRFADGVIAERWTYTDRDEV